MILIPLCVCLVPLLTSVPQHTQEDAFAHLQSLTLPMVADRDGSLSMHDIAVSLPSLTLGDQQSLKVFSSYVLTATFASLLPDDDDRKDGKKDGDGDMKDDDKKKQDKHEKHKSETDKAPKAKKDHDGKKPQAHSRDAAHPRGRFGLGDHRPGQRHRPPAHALRSGYGGRSGLTGKGPYRRPEYAGRSWHAGGRHEGPARSGFMHGRRQIPGRGWGMRRGPMGHGRMRMPHMAKPQSPKSPFAHHPQSGNAGAPFGPHFNPMHGSHLGSSSGPHGDPISTVLFELLDLNHDGNLSRDEFQRLAAATAKAHPSEPRMHGPNPKADDKPSPHHGVPGFEGSRGFRPGPPMLHRFGGNLGSDRNNMKGPPGNFPNGHRPSPPGDMRPHRRPEPGKTPDRKPDHETETGRRPGAEREPERSEKPESDAQPTQLFIDESKGNAVD